MGKKLTILLILTFVLSACTTKRVVTKEHTEYERQETIANDSVAFRFDDIVKTSRISRIDTSNFDFRIDFEVFDTDKPIGDCGQYPVKARGTVTGKQTKTNKDIVEIADTTHIVEVVNTSERNNTDETGNTTRKNDTKHERKDYFSLVFFLLIVACSFTAIKMITRQ